MIDQIEFANVLIINKVDLVDAETIHKIEGILRALNPEAKILRSSNAEVPIDEVLGTKLFDMNRTMQSPAWIKELNNEHTPETEEYGISSFVFRARRPFHPTRLMAYLNDPDWRNVIRSKGYMWLATRNDYGAMWSQAGTSCRLEPAGKWIAATPESEWPVTDEPSREELRKQLVGKFGDRRQEFVVIGQHIDAALIAKRLEACLLSEQEMQFEPAEWSKILPDPFPSWDFEVGA